jgi:hypothetical protein
MRRVLVLLAVLGLLIVGLAGPVGADSSARPFKAELHGDMMWGLDAECPITGVRTSSYAVGSVSHMGKTTMTGDHCTPAGMTYGVGEMVLVAANGDEVEAEYWGECPPYMELPIGEVLTCTMDFEITGGSGRFAGAHGSGTGSVSLIWLGIGEPQTTAWWTWEGTIGY